MSGDHEKPEIETHPSILHRERTGSAAVRVTGYIGSQRSGSIKIYSDLSGESYLEISEDDVVSLSPDKNEPGRVELFLSSDAKLARTTTSRISADSFATANVAVPPFLGEAIDFRLSQCEANYAAAMQEADIWLRVAQLNPGTQEGMEALELGRSMVIVGRWRLERCIDGVLNFPGRESRGAWLVSIYNKYLPVLPL